MMVSLSRADFSLSELNQLQISAIRFRAKEAKATALETALGHYDRLVIWWVDAQALPNGLGMVQMLYGETNMLSVAVLKPEVYILAEPASWRRYTNDIAKQSFKAAF